MDSKPPYSCHLAISTYGHASVQEAWLEIQRLDLASISMETLSRGYWTVRTDLRDAPFGGHPELRISIQKTGVPATLLRIYIGGETLKDVLEGWSGLRKKTLMEALG